MEVKVKPHQHQGEVPQEPEPDARQQPQGDELSLPSLEGAIIYMNTRKEFSIPKNYNNENSILNLAKKVDVEVQKVIITWEGGIDVTGVKDPNLKITHLLPKSDHVTEYRSQLRVDGGTETKGVTKRGGTTATNVLSINVAVVWKERDASLYW